MQFQILYLVYTINNAIISVANEIMHSDLEQSHGKICFKEEKTSSICHVFHMI